MYITTTDGVEALIKDNKLADLTQSIRADLFSLLIYHDRYDLISQIIQHFEGVITLEPMLFEGVLSGSSAGPNAASLACLDLLIASGKKGFSCDDDDALFYFCQIHENTQQLKLIHQLEAKLPWEYLLRTSCHYLAIDSVKYLVETINYSQSVLEEAFAATLNSSLNNCYHHSPEQADLIWFFLKTRNISVNAKTDSEWGFAYLECFAHVPQLSKWFYTPEFDPSILKNNEFWEELLDGMQHDEAYAECFFQAFEDLKNSHIDLSELIALFNELGHKEMAKALLS